MMSMRKYSVVVSLALALVGISSLASAAGWGWDHPAGKEQYNGNGLAKSAMGPSSGHYTSAPVRTVVPAAVAAPAVATAQNFSYSPAPVASFQVGDKVVAANGARLMRGGEVLGNVAQGQSLEVLQVRGNWIGAKVVVNGQAQGGWIDATQVSRPQAPVAALPPHCSGAGAK